MTGIAEELASAGFIDAREVGRGGCGVVHHCVQTSLGRSVAIKVLQADLDEENRERFLREGYAMGRLSGHPNIVNILQVGVTASNRPYIVMPYHAADSLALRLRHGGPISWPEALRIGVKLSGALETAHKAGTLHRDIKPGNVLVNDYGEPQLSDFGIAHITGGYETATGYFTGTMSYTAPEVLSGLPAGVQADVYSLAATLYALIAGKPAHERKSGEELVAHYLRISSTPAPDLRPLGIPDDVCTAIENAMSLDPGRRQTSAAEFGRELQAAQRHNGLPADSMALSEARGDGEQPVSPAAGQPVSATSQLSRLPEQTAETDSIVQSVALPIVPGPPPVVASEWRPGPAAPEWWSDSGEKPNRRPMLLAGLAAVVVLLLVATGVYFVFLRDSDAGPAPAQQASAEAQAGWQPITNARMARTAAATTQTDGTVWIFGGLAGDGAISDRHEGYDPVIDNWKGGSDLPVPVQHAMAVTWQGNPVVLGGWQTSGANAVASDQVWRVVNGSWVQLPHMLAPRAAAAAAVVGDRIIITGGVGANGALLKTTEIFDGTSWALGAEIPTPRKMLAAASDGRLLYAVGGTDATSDLASVEAYDPAADTWTKLQDLPDARSELGVTIADGRMVAAGGLSGGQVLKSVAVFDLAAKSWAGLPDMATARHGMAVAAVAKTVYAIGGSTDAGDSAPTSSAEALKLAPRKLQPAAQWRTLPDAPTARLMMAWAVADGKIWVISGLRDGAALQTVESYDPQTGVWQPGPPLPVPLHHATATTYRGEVVVIGGASENLSQATNKVFALRGGSWVELPSLTHARAAAAAAVVGDKLIVVGGQNAKQTVPQTEIFDGRAWKDAAELPIPREHLAAVSDGTYVYAVGGRFLSADKNSAAFERFDPQSNTWTTLNDMPTPRGSYGAAFVDGRIVAAGGEDPTQVLATAEMYDIAEAKWTALAPMPTPRHGEVVAAVGNTVYVIGGANRPTHEGAVATIEALDFA
jgi:serine/threonine protein kinase/N-acetylneuraminic acid mutarotase